MIIILVVLLGCVPGCSDLLSGQGPCKPIGHHQNWPPYIAGVSLPCNGMNRIDRYSELHFRVLPPPSRNPLRFLA